MKSLTLLLPALASIVITKTCYASTMPPDTTTEPAQYFTDHGSKRVKIRYGPFTVDSMDINNDMATFLNTSVQAPCTDCLITWMQAGLEYTNGTVANADTNFWLHHTVMINPSRNSTICPTETPYDPFFASGNERTAADICVSGTDQAGYYLNSGGSLAMLTELMNMDPTPQTGYVTVTYEFLPTPPSSFSRVKALWLDIGGCFGNSENPVKSTTQAFEYTSPPWVSDISGRITFMIGHLHDGGTHLDVRRNGTEVCDSTATYGANAEYVGGGMAMSMSMGSSSMSMSKRAAATATSMSSMDMSSMTMSMPATSTSMMTASPSSSSTMLMDNIHISNMSICANPNSGLVSPGDVWTITAHYDPTKHDLMMNTDGSAAPIMGISLVYVADLNTTTTASTTTNTTSTSSTSTPKNAGMNMGAASVIVYAVLTATIAIGLCL